MVIVETKNLILLTFTANAMIDVLNGKSSFLHDKTSYGLGKGWPINAYKNLFPYKISRFQSHPEEEEYEGIIIHKKDQLVIGDMGFKGGPDKHGIMEIGYSILPQYQGNGYATEMGKAFCKWGMNKENVHKIIATCSIYNHASIRVLEKIGMKKLYEELEKYYWELPYSQLN
ncbi:GNAT family N-acetyltransferase [Bacillus sp. EAC]|uniref:GNAT family N-acetyltransferase n=1 Tax=Bacillus sp. EAC TaxID=1978338 RepID=UPI000B450E45|nr:GNAT family N-acetyltransferase [Bacillus sp. EAC]